MVRIAAASMVSPERGRKRCGDEEDQDQRAAELARKDRERRRRAALCDRVGTISRAASGGLGRGQPAGISLAVLSPVPHMPLFAVCLFLHVIAPGARRVPLQHRINSGCNNLT
jgi:hypothetical protein